MCRERREGRREGEEVWRGGVGGREWRGWEREGARGTDKPTNRATHHITSNDFGCFWNLIAVSNSIFVVAEFFE